MMTAGAAGLAAAPLALSGVPLWTAAALLSILLNAGLAVLYLTWLELYSQMGLMHVLVYFTLTHFASALTTFFVESIASQVAVTVIAAFMPLGSLAMLLQANARPRNAAYSQGERQKTGWTISVRPLLLLGAFGFSNATIHGFIGTEDQVTVLLGVCVAALGVLVAVFWRIDRFEVKSLYQVSVPVLVAGFLFVLMSFGWSGVAAALCSNAAYALFSIFVTAVFCGISYRYGVNAVWIFGITQASRSIGSFVGNLASTFGKPLYADPAMLVVVISGLVVLMVALSMTLVSDRDFATTWGVASRSQGTELLTVLDEEERTTQTCARVARRYGLTRREEEVLVLMMRGYTLARIGAELYVADSTMKTHSRHIYRKVGVKNRQELQEFVAALRG